MNKSNLGRLLDPCYCDFMLSLNESAFMTHVYVYMSIHVSEQIHILHVHEPVWRIQASTVINTHDVHARALWSR